MIDRTLRIGDLIEVPPVRTVIRLEEGRTQSESIAASFVFTEEVASHFSVLADALLKDRGKGFFLQGDFGSGLAAMLSRMVTLLPVVAYDEILVGTGVEPIEVISILQDESTTPEAKELIGVST